MTTNDPHAGPLVYEFTVTGPVGPVLRAALRPHAVARSSECTIMRVEHADSRDLVDLLQRLSREGLSVEEVAKINET